MGKKRFFDDRLKYLSFIQNTSEKRAMYTTIDADAGQEKKNKSTFGGKKNFYHLWWDLDRPGTNATVS